MIRTTFALMLMIAPAVAQPADVISEKQCIIGAAQKLPTVPGLTIEASRTKPRASKAGEPPSYDVEIDVKAAGTDATIAFVCLASKKGAFVEPLGIKR